MSDTDYDSRIKSLEEQVAKLTKGSKPKRVRDPNAPKKAPSKYNTFMKEFVANKKKTCADKGVDYVHKGVLAECAAAWKKQKAETVEEK